MKLAKRFEGKKEQEKMKGRKETELRSWRNRYQLPTRIYSFEVTVLCNRKRRQLEMKKMWKCHTLHAWKYMDYSTPHPSVCNHSASSTWRNLYKYLHFPMCVGEHIHVYGVCLCRKCSSPSGKGKMSKFFFIIYIIKINQNSSFYNFQLNMNNLSWLLCHHYLTVIVQTHCV